MKTLALAAVLALSAGVGHTESIAIVGATVIHPELGLPRALARDSTVIIDGNRIVSHDYGMVGFVKALVDEVMSRGIRPSMSAPLTRPDRLAAMHVHKGAVVLRRTPAF